MNVHLLVPAAGSGRRLGTTQKKQYLELARRPILVQTLTRLAAQPAVTGITVVVPPGEAGYFRRELVERFALQKIATIADGGAERQDSVRNGLLACGAAADDVVLIHDAVRPFFPAEAFVELIGQAAAIGAAVLAIPAQDTIKEAIDGRVCRTLERSRLWQVQTPQAFRFEVIMAAHQAAQKAGYVGTDDASLVEWRGEPVALVPGSAYNFKITTPADLAVARALLAAGEVELL